MTDLALRGAIYTALSMTPFFTAPEDCAVYESDGVVS